MPQPTEITQFIFGQPLKLSMVKAAKDIFGEDNIRFYGGGIPEVFLDAGGRGTADKVEQLLDWSSTPT